jgi:hypothetical protein
MKGIINKFNSSDKNITRDPNTADTLRTSTIHNEYSINGNPNVTLASGRPLPPASELDLDGKTPKTYKDNSPEAGARI